jgi:microcystin-dependent protein
MKHYLILAALASIHANVFAQPPTPGSSHVAASGDFAVVSFQSGMITGSLFVSQCGTNKQPQTCLNYFIALAPIPPPPPPPGGPPPPPPRHPFHRKFARE